MKRKTVAAMLMGTMILATGVTGFAAEKYTNRVDPVNSVTEYETYEVDEAVFEETMEDFVKTLDMLTEKEKQMLIQEDKEAQPYYKEISRLSIEIEEKTNKILEKAESYFDQRGEILLGKNSKIWDKMWDSLSEEQKETDDYEEIIKASKVLSKSEKDLLLKEQKQLDKIDEKIDSYYAKAEKETKKLREELEKNQKELEKIQTKTEKIWEKVYGPQQIMIIDKKVEIG